MADLSYCAAQVRDFDNDRFLTALFAPAELSEPLMTLYAFNLELSKIRETVSEPLIGRMRLQFWRDAVDGIVDGTPPAHEIAKALSQTVRAHNILKADLHTLIDAREIDLDDVPPADIPATVSYAEATSSSVIVMALRVLGVDPETHADAVRDAGIAYALVGLVRAIPYQASTGRVTLPLDLCQAAGLDHTAPHQWPQNPDVSAITKPLLAVASDHLSRARASARSVPRQGLAAFLPLSLAALYLKRLNAVGGDPKRFHERPPAATRHITLLWRSMRGAP
jgi:phytoene synthase